MEFVLEVRKVSDAPSSDLPVLDVTGLGGVKVGMHQRLVLTDSHLSATDADTLLAAVVDPSKITFRISAVEGGKLQRLSSSDVWEDMTLETGEAYYAFTFADLQAGKIAFLAGDGLQASEGEQITFQVQAVDDDGNLSDSDAAPGAQAADGTIAVDSAAVTAAPGESTRINADDVLTPGDTVLSDWIGTATTHGGTLHVVVQLEKKQDGDVLSLKTGYDTSKITTLVWDGTKGELDLEIDASATTQEIQTALGLLEFKSLLSSSESARKVWLFPTLSGLGHLSYRVDQTAGLVRYYFYDRGKRNFSSASSAAAGRSLFGKQGYLGLPLSDAEKNIYMNLRSIAPRTDVYLAISDSDTEEKWLIMSGPRKGQLFWDHTADPKVYGPGAAGSGWSAQEDFWFSGEPPGGFRGTFYDYAKLGGSGGIVTTSANTKRPSISHHDLWLLEGEIFARVVKAEKSLPNPVLTVDFSEVRATAERPLILTEDHISVDDPDTRDPLDATKVDASKIKFRITNIAHGTLHERADTGTSTPWTQIVADGSNAYLEFTLAQLQGGLVAFVPDASASPLTFDIQAADDGMPNDPTSSPNLSDSDPSTSDLDPESVSVPVVALKKVVVGEEVRINGDGVLTPDDNTLDAWLAADDTLRIFVVLQRGKSGIFTPSAGVVHEHLSVASSHGVASSKIAVSWDARNWRLVLLGTNTATRANFQAVLDALQLQTVPFGQVSHRTISVRPDTSDMLVSVARTRYYLRGVEVSASAPNPVLELDFDKPRVDPGQRFVLMEKHILVYDPDTLDGDGNVDPSRISFRITGLTGGTLQKLFSDDPPVWRDISPSGTGLNQYREFTLAELRAGKIAFLAGDGLASGEGKKIVFQVQAADNAGNLSDSDPDDGQSDADPVDGEIPVFPSTAVIAGERSLINADELLTPNDPTLDIWKQTATTYNSALYVVVKLLDKQKKDVLSLRSGYDANKITPDWKESIGELWLKTEGGTTAAEIQAALKLLELNTKIAGSASTRQVWIFPILTEIDTLRYHVDESAGLVRYYLYDSDPPVVFGCFHGGFWAHPFWQVRVSGGSRLG